MEEARKDELLNIWFKKVEKVSQMTDVAKQMRAYLNLRDFLAEIWEEGRLYGVEQAKEIMFRKKSN